MSTGRRVARIVVVIGVAGAGKTTVGRALAAALGWPFADGDDRHDEASRAKMRAGLPLDDADRAPWLARLAGEIAAWARTGTSAVLACSALRARYRATLRAAAPTAVRFVWLDLPAPLAAARIETRAGHFMPAALVASQYAALEPPAADEAIHVDATRPVAEIVARVRAALER
ncbi:MAG TPA: gluconokinase [Gemmatimonadales bacterium]|nr:gluconokinase [Gemmatimonadales bacterium]